MQREFFFFNKNNRDTENIYACLTSITHLSGAITKYTYEKTILNLGDQGTKEEFRIKTREEIVSGVSSNKLTYSYVNHYSGYPTHADPEVLPSSHKYEMVVTNHNNISTRYIFNNNHLLEQEEKKQNNQVII